jgi:hypothetical protein
LFKKAPRLQMPAKVDEHPPRIDEAEPRVDDSEAGPVAPQALAVGSSKSLHDAVDPKLKVFRLPVWLKKRTESV